MQLEPEQFRPIDEFIFAGQKIQAVKLYRQLSGSDLAEAVQAIDERTAELEEKDPTRFQPAEPRRGCMGMILVVIGALAGAAGASSMLWAR
jgi:hypothetical protein